jgi:uncharacterized RDD family membrane protein YckC
MVVGGHVACDEMKRESARRSPAENCGLERIEAMETAPLNYATPSSDAVRVGILPRFLAGLVDGIVLLVLTAVPTIVLRQISPMLAGIVGAVLALAYMSLEVLKAQSVGKMVFKLKITKQDGSPATQDQLIKRYAFKQAPNLLSIVASVLIFVPLIGLLPGLAALAVLACSLFMLKPEKLAFYDQLFGTAVYGPAKVTFTVPTAADLKPTSSITAEPAGVTPAA